MDPKPTEMQPTTAVADPVAATVPTEAVTAVSAVTPESATAAGDEFAAAFAELNDPKPAEPAGSTTGATDPKVAAAAAAATPSAATPPTATVGTETTAAPAAASATESAATATAGGVTLEQFNELQRRLDEALAARPEPATPTAQPKPALYTAEEQAALTKYDQEWPDVAAAEQLKRRGEYNLLVQHVFDQLVPMINAIQERMPALETSTAYRDLKEMIPDYDTVRDPVVEWVAKQPGWMREAMEKVTNDGTPEQIKELVDQFKTATGWQAPAATSSTAPAAPTAAPATPRVAAPNAPAATPAAAALPAAAAAAAASLKPVKAGRTDPPKAQDPNDFDGAWAEFAKAS